MGATSTRRGARWGLGEVEELFRRPLLELVFEAAVVHRGRGDAGEVQCSQLLSIKTGGCPEDCGYCSQSGRWDAGVERTGLAEVGEVVEAARRAREGGADRFCMGAAWRGPRDGEEFERVLEMVRGVKALGMETCCTLGMLSEEQARRLAEAGLDYYNHNLDTGETYYGEVVTTRGYGERLETLERARAAGMRLCCGGILGLGEGVGARAELLHRLATMEPPPESVPINTLVHVPGTPLAAAEPVDWSELVRTVAAARILMPEATIRLSAGRTGLSEEAQALCFLAGASSIFVGDELLTTPNPSPSSDAALLAKLGLRAVAARA